MSGMSGMDVWEELLGNRELLSSQYDVIAGRMPEQYNEVVVIVTRTTRSATTPSALWDSRTLTSWSRCERTFKTKRVFHPIHRLQL